MITFFRRIRQKLIDSGSVTKYLLYAIGEILLVVIGILIALQVNNWNENRKVRASEAEILKNLRIELISNRDRLNDLLDTHRDEYEDGLILLNLFNKDVSGIPESKLDSMLGNLETVYTFEANDGYIKSLIASGKIDHIQNAELKSYLSSFDGMVIDAIQENDQLQRLLHERLWPAIDGKMSTLNRLATYAEYQDFPGGTYPSDYGWLFGSREMEDVLGNIISWKKTILDEELVLKESIDKMIQLIESDLNRMKISYTGEFQEPI